MADSVRPDRENMEYDALIIGAGPSGLSCAIRLKQASPALTICVLEKGAEVGAHIMSGAAIDPRSLDELIPEWRGKSPSLTTKATEDHFVFLTKKLAIRLPTPPQMNNRGNYVGSLGNLCRWLAEQAEALGIEIFPGFAAAEVLYDQQGAVIGVATGDVGIGRDGEKTDQFQPGMELHARQTIFAEGCHGSLTKMLVKKFDLRKDSDPQTYGIGVKELWEIKPENHKPGKTMHTIGWPLDHKTYSGSWVYHFGDNLVSLGLVIGLDYRNTYIYPFKEMQRFKLHPAIRPMLQGGRRVAYGARALSEGGFQSLPRLTFPGGLLVGDTAGFLNVPKIKGTHTSMKSGMLAAEALAEYFARGTGNECFSYPERLKKSWLWKELKKVRNVRPGFRYGLFLGLINAGFETLTAGLAPWTFRNHADHSQLKKKENSIKIDYPKPDGEITFDILSSVQLSNTNHAEDQPVHLQLKDPAIPIAVNLPLYDEPAQRYCPAAVYEVVQGPAGEPKFQINAQNCVHCKTCDIKDPSQNINWTVPHGGDGPNYPNM